MINYELICKKIKEADAVLIGASNGFSISEGLHIFADNEAFRELFGDYREKYGIRSILQGFFFQWPNEKEKWSFTSRLIDHYNNGYSGSPLMDSVKKIVSQKPYFIVTSNGENHFELAGLDAKNILEIEGSWKYMSCSNKCHASKYPVDFAYEMASLEREGKDFSHFIPSCPKCGGPMEIDLNPNPAQIDAFRQFVSKWHGKRLLVLEFGIGAGNQMIKRPLMELVLNESNAFYITFNKGDIYIPRQIADKSLGVDASLNDVIPLIARNL